MIDKFVSQGQRNPSEIVDGQSQEQFARTEFSPSLIQQRKNQNHNLKTILHPNRVHPSSDTIKQLLLDRFKHKKQILLQSTSIYIDTGEIKKKYSAKDKAQIASQIKNTSLQKLPFLNNDRPTPFLHRLSQTIDGYSQFSKSLSSETTTIPSSSTLECNTNLGKAKLHLSKRKSFHESNDSSSILMAEDGPKKKNETPKNSSFFVGFDEDVRKKYLKSIVDRYFPNQESPQKDVQHYFKKTSKDSKNTAKSKQNTIKSSIISSQKLFKQGRLPALNSAKQQNQNQDPRLVRFLQPKQTSQTQDLSSTSAEMQGQELQNQNNQGINSNSSALSLSQSYLLEKIQEDEEETQGFKGQDFYNNSRFQNKSSSTYFPHLTFQSSSEFIMNSSSQDLFNIAKSSSLESQNKSKEQSMKVYENRSFSIFKVKHTSFQNLSQNHNLRTISVTYEFKKYFRNEPSIELKKREMKAKHIILSQCGQCFGEMWEEDMFDKTCIRLNITKNSPPCNAKLLPLTLSKLLYKISPQMQSGSSSFLVIKPCQSQKPAPFVTQESLLSDSHYGLLSLLLNISLPFSKLSGNLINNKLSLNNVFFRDFNSYSVNEWAYSYFKQEFLIQDKKFQKRQEPILKNQFGEWFVTPEYLAPEILENLCFSKEEVVKYWVKREGKKMEKSIVKEHDLFEHGNKADVWSLGLMIVEIITLIPVWIGEKCIVENRTNPSIKPRRGLLFSEKRDLLKMLTKQSYLKEDLNRIIRVESEPYQIQEWLVKLLHRMLELDADKRISFEEIVEFATKRLKK